MHDLTDGAEFPVEQRVILGRDEFESVVKAHTRDKPEAVIQEIIDTVWGVFNEKDPVEQVLSLVEMVRSHLAFKAQLREVIGLMLIKNAKMASLETQLGNALIDELTAIPMRRQFKEDLNVVVQQGLQANPEMPYPIVFLMFDIDHFGDFNTQYGHDGGDAVLKEVAQVIQDNVPRRADPVCRWGGEEFAIVLSDCSAENGLKIADKIRKAVKGTQIHIPGVAQPVSVKISGGVCGIDLHNQLGRDGDWVLDRIKKAADSALYHSKRNGRNMVISAHNMSTEERMAANKALREMKDGEMK